MEPTCVEIEFTFPNDGESPSQKASKSIYYLHDISEDIEVKARDSKMKSINTVSVLIGAKVSFKSVVELEDKLTQRLPSDEPYSVAVTKAEGLN